MFSLPDSNRLSESRPSGKDFLFWPLRCDFSVDRLYLQRQYEIAKVLCAEGLLVGANLIK